VALAGELVRGAHHSVRGQTLAAGLLIARFCFVIVEDAVRVRACSLVDQLSRRVLLQHVDGINYALHHAESSALADLHI
jgi:hypothetical protein